MLRHIFKLIGNNLRSNLLLMAGLFVISTALWYAVDYVYTVAVNAQKSLGFDWRHVYYVQADVLPPTSAERDTARRTDDHATADHREFCNRILRHPAVESLCWTRMHFHYVWKNTSTTLRLDTLSTWALLRYVSPEYFTVFRVKGADGSSPEQLTRAAQNGGMVLTEDLARNLLAPPVKGSSAGSPDVRPAELVGRTVKDVGNNNSMRVSAVCENQKYNEYGDWQHACYVVSVPGNSNGGQLSYGSIPYIDRFIRVKAEADGPDFVRTFRREMRRQLRVGNLYLADMRPMSQFRDRHLADDRSDLYTYLSVAGFFLVNAFLAVLGTFWFRTQQRREELAVRLVAGATPRSLMRLLMAEGALLVTMAYVPALVVAFNLGHADLVSTWPVPWTVGRFVAGGLITYVILLAVTAFSIWFPARQAMRIQPAEALHGE